MIPLSPPQWHSLKKSIERIFFREMTLKKEYRFDQQKVDIMVYFLPVGYGV